MLKLLYIRVKYLIITFLFYFMRIFKIRSNKIVFDSWYGGSFGDNGKYITLELLSRKGRNYDIVWLAQDCRDESYPKEVRKVNSRSIRAIYELSTSKVWVDNVRKGIYVRKRKGQYYINTGHGGIPLKKIEKDAESELKKQYIKTAKHDSKMVDLMTSNASFRTNILKSSYWYNGEVSECGSPKIEQIMIPNEGLKKKICDKYHLDLDTFIVLYAPTFRKDHHYDYGFNPSFVKNAFEQKFGGNWSVFKRMHPGVTDATFNEDDSIDVSDYPDMQELLKICDALITDYSGTMFELLYDDKKMVFLYAKDINSYDRGFYFTLSELPFSFANSLDELERNILRFDQYSYSHDVEQFSSKIGLVKTVGASKEVCDQIDRYLGLVINP